jgi:hypothetical protein
MRKLLLLAFSVLVGSAAGFLSPSLAKATTSSCTTYCSAPDACGYVCCYKQCCNGRCVILDCAPPPPCDFSN